MCEVGGEYSSASHLVNHLDWGWEEERTELSSPAASGLRVGTIPSTTILAYLMYIA